MTALVDRLRPRLRAMRVDLVATVVASVDVDAVLATEPAADERAPLAQVWLDGRSSSDAIVILVPRRADRVLARKIVGGAAFDEVALAEAVFVIERATASLLASRPVGVPKADAASELRPTVAPPPIAAAPTLESSALPPRDESLTPAASPSPAPSAASPPPLAAAPVEPTITAAPAPAATVVAPRDVTEPAPPLGRRRSPSAWVGVFVGTESLTDGNRAVPQVGLAALFERVGASARIGVIVDGDLHRAVDVPSEFGTVELGGGGAHALVSLGRTFGHGVGRVGLGLGLTVSDVRVTTEPNATLLAARRRTDLDPTLALQVRWDLPLATSIDVFAVASADVAFVSGRYTADFAGTTTTLLSAWPVRPTLRLGVAFGR